MLLAPINQFQFIASSLIYLFGGRAFIMERPTKRAKRGFIIGDGDLISRLPREILISILSLLTLKQATVTSVLSRSWEKLWTFYHGDLDLKVTRMVQLSGCSYYARLVNKVLNTLEQIANDSVLDSFTIHCTLCPNNLGYVDRWVQFALEKRRVKRLVFDPIFCSSGCSRHRVQYDFPPLEFVIAHQRNIHALTSIHFYCVNISCGIIEHLLANCPLLETLDLIKLSMPLTHLKVSGESLALKYLQIRSCLFLTTIEIISAPNLVSFSYISPEERVANFCIGNVPKLVEFSFGVLRNPPLIASALHLLRCFSCLQKLELHINFKEPGDLIKLVELPSVKHFTMCISGYNCEHVLEWTPLLKAFPYLQQFTLDMSSRKDCKIDRVKTRDDDDDNKFPSKCLEVFEFVGFGRFDDDIELVIYLLRKMMVHPEKILLLCDGGTPIYAVGYDQREKKALSIAGKLKQIIPRDVNLLFHKPRVPVGTMLNLISQSLI